MYHSRCNILVMDGAAFGTDAMIPPWAGGMVDIDPYTGLVLTDLCLSWLLTLRRKVFVDSENDDEGPNANASELVSVTSE
jgi:hypothetical protein